MHLNILDCFDDNISNLDITKNYIYVLKLIEERYYVGRTSNILKRIEEHFTVGGSLYTKKYKPIKVIEVCEEISNDDERLKTLEIMDKYGWENVRGSCWCSLEIKKPYTRKRCRKIKKESSEYNLVPNSDDEIIKKLYSNNENIVEIGNKLNLSPGSIAFRLEKLGVIEKRQLARGYFEYTCSELYETNKKNCNEIKCKNKQTNKHKIEVLETSLNEVKADLLNLKQIIREKYLMHI